MFRGQLFAIATLSALVSGCDGDSITNITIIEAEKSAQAPLVFAQQSIEIFIDNDPVENSLSGGSGSGNISYVVSDDSIASVDPNTGIVTPLDDGIVTIQATKAGDEVYQATSVGYELKINKYERSWQILSFLDDEYIVQLVDAEDEGNPFLATIDTPKATTQVEVGVNLPAGDTYLDPNDFDWRNTATFNASTSTTIYDSLGEPHIQSFYFIKDANSPVVNEWLLVTAIDGEFYDYANADGSDPEDPTAYAGAWDNWVGFNSVLDGPGGSLIVNGLHATRLTFSSGGDLVSISTPDGVTLPGGGTNLQFPTTIPLFGLRTGAATTQTLALNLNLDTSGIGDWEPTQFGASFEVFRLEQDGYGLGILDDSMVTYQSEDVNVAMVDDDGRLTLINRGETMILATVAEDDRYQARSVGYYLIVR